MQCLLNKLRFLEGYHPVTVHGMYPVCEFYKEIEMSGSILCKSINAGIREIGRTTPYYYEGAVGRMSFWQRVHFFFFFFELQLCGAVTMQEHMLLQKNITPRAIVGDLTLVSCIYSK